MSPIDTIREIVAALAQSPAGIVVSLASEDGEAIGTTTWVLGRDHALAACLDAIATAIGRIDCGLSVAIEGADDLVSDGSEVRLN